jgi:hypothetical protein
MSRRKRALVLSLAPLLCALPALSQSREVSVDQADGCTLDAVWLERKPAFVLPTSSTFDHTDGQALTAPLTMPKLDLELNEALLTTSGDDPKADSSSQPPTERLSPSKPRDFNRDTYYKNKLEFSFDAGWLPINIPFPLDFFVGDAYNTYPLKYTLVPMIASLRWHLNDVGGPRILRGNFDLTFSLSVTAIPRGPESRSRPTSTCVSGSETLTRRDPKESHMRKVKTPHLPYRWVAECDITSILVLQFREA